MNNTKKCHNGHKYRDMGNGCSHCNKVQEMRHTNIKPPLTPRRRETLKLILLEVRKEAREAADKMFNSKDINAFLKASVEWDILSSEYETLLALMFTTPKKTCRKGHKYDGAQCQLCQKAYHAYKHKMGLRGKKNAEPKQ